MHILLTTDHYPPTINGIVTHVLLTKKELERRGHTVTVLTSTFNKKTHQHNEYLLSSFKTPIRPTDPITIPFNKKIETLLLKQDFDIVHNHLFFTGFMGLKIAKKKNIPTVITLHTLFNTFLDWSIPGSKYFYPLADRLAYWYLNKHDLIIAPSPKSLHELERLKLAQKSQLLLNGIDLPDTSSIKTTDFYNRFSLHKNDQIVTIVGRVDPGKNVDLAVRSLRLIVEQYSQVKLVIIGDGSLLHSIQLLVHKLSLEKNVVMTGFLDREMIDQANKASQFMLFTSDSDNLPTVVIEAIGLGKPIVTIQDEAISQMAVDGYNALVVEKNEQALAHAMTTLLKDSNLRAKFGEKSLEISKKFSIQTQVDLLEKLYYEQIEKLKINRIIVS